MPKNSFVFVPGLQYRCIESGSYSFKVGNIYSCVCGNTFVGEDENETYLLFDVGSKLRTKTLISKFELASDLSQPLEELL